MNDVQEELINVLIAAGIAPVKGTQNQIYRAIAKIIQGQSVAYFPTTGTSTAQVLTPTPALSGYAEGQRFSVVFNVASGLNPNIKVSNLNGKFLKQYDTTGAKVQAVWAAGQAGDIFYDGTDFVLLNPATGVTQAAENVLGSIKIATQTLVDAGADDATAVTPKKLAVRIATTLGYAQTTQDLTASRSAGVTYTNSTGRPIFVIVLVADAGGSGSFTFNVDGLTINFGNPSTGTQQISFIIPPGGTYGNLVLGGNTLIKWLEFR